MWPYTDIENKWIGGVNPHAGWFKTATPGEIELMARKMQNQMFFELIAALARPVGRTLAWLASPLAAWWTRTQVYDELMGMDDRMLDDIGISRSDIPAVASGRYEPAVLPAPRLVAGQVNRLRRPDAPAAHNDQAARVA
jgi:uncharacterized protein YjiS (DUF1127 family)